MKYVLITLKLSKIYFHISDISFSKYYNISETTKITATKYGVFIIATFLLYSVKTDKIGQPRPLSMCSNSKFNLSFSFYNILYNLKPMLLSK